MVIKVKVDSKLVVRGRLGKIYGYQDFGFDILRISNIQEGQLSLP